MDMIFPAHITEIDGKRKVQTVTEHLNATARYASEKLKSSGLENTARLAGLIHDAGKYCIKFKNYIELAADGGDVARGSVNHTFCAVIYLMERYHAGEKQGYDTIACEIIAYAVGSHHGEFDAVSPDGINGFLHRLEADKNEICYDEAIGNFLSLCADEKEIDELFSASVVEITALLTKITGEFGKGKRAVCFYAGLVARLLLSALADADRRDTAEFMSGKKFNYAKTGKDFWEKLLSGFEEKISGFKNDSEINKARSFFSEQCRNFGRNNGGGIYRLALPTGAGKTLSALGFALSNAARFSKKRIIFVIPLLSILEQNSAVIHKYTGNPDIITEHHSNFVKDFDSPERLDNYELLAQTWEAPIVVTTLVQLLNTLFSGKISSVRRMSALTDSVIVIDEIQSLPQKTISMFNAAANFLAYCCGATVVLSSATQPCFEELKNGVKYSGDIVPYDEKIFGVFKRTRLIDKTDPYGMTADELADFAAEKAESVLSTLVICNTKNTALALFKALKQRKNGYSVYHLSASMCMRHRTDVLEKIKNDLSAEKKVICVSTQIIEAGVDISFRRVIRVEAGMDSVAQAAGRCNRNGDFGELCDVFVVNLKNGAENLKMLREIATAQRCTSALFGSFKKDEARFRGDLFSDESIREYYRLLLGDEDTKRLLDYPAKLPDKNPVKLFDLLSDNSESAKRSPYSDKCFIKQSFKTAGELFEVFDEASTDIIVPYNNEAKEIIADLFGDKAAFDYAFLARTLEKAKPYLIRIFEYQRRKLSDDGMISADKNGHFTALNPLCYDGETGLEIDSFIL